MVKQFFLMTMPDSLRLFNHVAELDAETVLCHDIACQPESFEMVKKFIVMTMLNRFRLFNSLAKSDGETFCHANAW